ncbi:FAD-dependent oxidoreductase [Leptolyngbya sp. 15MV]|nr:FAD-dependent oxidoreductase [Leptolyngbya sp. 15MV]
MRVAIVGSGISGLVCGHLLHRAHDITLFEADTRIGGHTNTVEATIDGRSMPVDTGFIVFNRRTYPRFTALLESLGVAWQDSAMSFSVSCVRTGLEYGGEGLDGLFAQRGNLLRLEFLRMVRDILRFGRDAPRLARELPESATLGDLLRRERYGRLMASHYLLPMGSAIWSASRAQMLAFPLRFFVSFFDNHGMLLPGTRPQWLTVAGGARRYVEAITRPWADRLVLGCAVRRVSRDGSGVDLVVESGGRTRSERFDHVILACHSDQALAMLSDPSRAEREVPNIDKHCILVSRVSPLAPRTERSHQNGKHTLTPRESAATLLHTAASPAVPLREFLQLYYNQGI